MQHHNGLTDFGKQVVLEMNRLGMMVDISHVADKTFWDAIATTKAPVIASHSSARALVDAPRNMTDDMLRAVAKNGGVVQVNFYSGFDDEDFRKAMEAQAKDQAAAIQKYTDQLKAEGKPVNYVDVDRIEREWMAKIPRPPLQVADRSHRPHRENCGHRSRGPGLRFRRRERRDAAGHRLGRRSAEDYAGSARSRLQRRATSRRFLAAICCASFARSNA